MFVPWFHISEKGSPKFSKETRGYQNSTELASYQVATVSLSASQIPAQPESLDSILSLQSLLRSKFPNGLPHSPHSVISFSLPSFKFSILPG